MSLQYLLLLIISVSILFNAILAWRLLKVYKNRPEIIQKNEAMQTRQLSNIKLLGDIIDNAGSAIITVDTAGIITTWNKKAESIFGFTKAMICNKRINELDLPEDSYSFNEVVNEVLESGELNQLELRKKHKDGSSRDLIMTVTPLKNEGGDVSSIAFVMEDFTDRNQLIDTIINQEKLIAGIESLNRLLATLSHYINNSISAISAMADLTQLDKKYSDKFLTVTQMQLVRIDAVLKSLARLVHDLNLKTSEYVGQKDLIFDIENEIKEFLASIKKEPESGDAGRTAEVN